VQRGRDSDFIVSSLIPGRIIAWIKHVRGSKGQSRAPLPLGLGCGTWALEHCLGGDLNSSCCSNTQPKYKKIKLFSFS